MRFLTYSFFAVFLAIVISGCGQGQQPTEEKTGEAEETAPSTEEVTPTEYPQFHTAFQPDERVVKMVTSKGDITIRLFPAYAPLAVENFITHSENGYYDGVLFHRVIEDFMIQSGDPEGTGRGGESIYGEPFADEFSPALGHFRGALSMANAGPNTNGSQFFIVHANTIAPNLFQQLDQAGFQFPQETIKLYELHGGTPFLDYRHTVFGHVFEGMDVVDAIAQVATGPNDRPIEDVYIERIEILQ